MSKLRFPALTYLAVLAVIALVSSPSTGDVSSKAYSEIVGDNPVATLAVSDDEPPQVNVGDEYFSGDSWYEAGITVRASVEDALQGWHVDGNPYLSTNTGIDLLLVLDEPATELGFWWLWGYYSSSTVGVSLYSDTDHTQLVGGINLNAASDGEPRPPGSVNKGYSLGILSTDAFQSVRIATSSTHATIDDLVFVASPEPTLLMTQLAALLTLSLLCWKRS